jgi:hypothetical protein
MKRHILLLSTILSSGFCDAALAQVGSATYQWQLSTDDGQTWSTGLTEVPSSTSNVFARVRIDASAGAGNFYGLAMDAAVRSSPGDFATDITNPSVFSDLRAVASRVEPFLKIERTVADPELPGLGTSWYRIGPVFPQVNLPIPSTVLQFRFTLDGSLGERQFTQVFDPRFGLPEGRLFFARVLGNGSVVANYPTMTVTEATLRVVPTPGTLVPILAVAAAMVTRRRRFPANGIYRSLR